MHYWLKWSILEVLGQNFQNKIFQQKHLEHFSQFQALTNCKSLEKIINGLRAKPRMHSLTRSERGKNLFLRIIIQ